MSRPDEGTVPAAGECESGQDHNVRAVKVVGHTRALVEKAVRKAGWSVREAKRQLYFRTVLAKKVYESRRKVERACLEDFRALRLATLDYVSANRKPDDGFGAYSYKPGGPALLYSSCYSALIRHLYGDLESLSLGDRARWVAYLQEHQSDDGLFRDPVIACSRAEEMDWWGTRHLTLHVLMALSALGGVAEKAFKMIDPFRKPGGMVDWLETRNWRGDAAAVSNEVQNYATVLQYARDFQGERWCDDALNEMYLWLDRHQDPDTGLWGAPFNTPRLLSNGVVTSYHLWLLYFYDGRPVKYMDRIIDSCLATQNPLGGFGVAWNSSACEDIDSVDPLARLYHLIDYRRSEVRGALKRALPWILSNADSDGGWHFRLHEAFWLHDQMCTGPDESSMFATWFRTLSLAFLSRVLSDMPVAAVGWHFLQSPGHQFWKTGGVSGGKENCCSRS